MSEYIVDLMNVKDLLGQSKRRLWKYLKSYFILQYDWFYASIHLSRNAEIVIFRSAFISK